LNEEPLNDISTKALSRLTLKELQVRCDALGVRIEPSIDDQLAAIALRGVDSVKQGRMRQALHDRVLTAHEEIRHADEELRLAAREGIRNTSGYANVGVLPFARKPYEASVWRGGKLVHLGNFGTAEKAAQCVAQSPEGLAAAATMSGEKGLRKTASESATGDVASEFSIGSRSAPANMLLNADAAEFTPMAAGLRRGGNSSSGSSDRHLLVSAGALLPKASNAALAKLDKAVCGLETKLAELREREAALLHQAWRRTKGLGRKKKEGRTPVGCVSAIRDDLDQLEPVLTRAIHPGASVPYVRARRTRLLRAVRTRGAKHGTCAVRVPASGVPYYVPYY
jgi:hypothetical protein